MDTQLLEQAIRAQMKRDLGLYPPVWWSRLDKSQQDEMFETALFEIMETVVHWDLWYGTELGGASAGTGTGALRDAVEPWVLDGLEEDVEAELVTSVLDEVLKRIVGWSNWYWTSLANRLNEAASIHEDIYGKSIGGVYGIGLGAVTSDGIENDG